MYESHACPDQHEGPMKAVRPSEPPRVHANHELGHSKTSAEGSVVPNSDRLEIPAGHSWRILDSKILLALRERCSLRVLPCSSTTLFFHGRADVSACINDRESVTHFLTDRLNLPNEQHKNTVILTIERFGCSSPHRATNIREL